jgi:hypothetical protein
MRMVLLLVLTALLASGCEEAGRSLTEQVQYFRDTVAAADRLRVRSGGGCCRNIAEEKTLYELLGKPDVADFLKHLEFAGIGGECECCGDPTFEFYHGEKLLAMVSYHHGRSLRWRRKWTGDAHLTKASREWLVGWLAEHAVEGPKQEIEEQLESIRIARLAEREWTHVVPTGFLAGIERAEDSPGGGGEESSRAKDDYIESFFGSRSERFLTLFRIMGSLPMRWDAYYPMHRHLREYFLRMREGDEDFAFELAIKSKDPAVRMGAARVLFTLYSRPDPGKVGWDVRAWMLGLAPDGYSSPIAGNRRLVVHCLAGIKGEESLAVLAEAARDPDRTVRRRAMVALGGFDDAKATEVLRKMALGELRPHPAPDEGPLDFAKGCGLRHPIVFMDEDEIFGSDEMAARRILAKAAGSMGKEE